MSNEMKPATKGARRTAENKEQRLQHAAALSQSKTATEVCTELGISTRTLKRYMADPRWQENGGVQLTLTERGRPAQETLSTAEKRQLTEAHALHAQGHKWVEVAEIMEIPIGRLEYLRRKERDTET